MVWQDRPLFTESGDHASLLEKDVFTFPSHVCMLLVTLFATCLYTATAVTLHRERNLRHLRLNKY